MTTLNELISPIFTAPTAETEGMDASIKPVRYRYVMTYLHAETVDGVLHQPGEVIAVLSMTQVNYSVGMYAGTDMNGNVFLPDTYIDLMPHQPGYDYERWPHPEQQGATIGSMFACGNRAIYVMRNEEVVWGGILWTRSYTAGTPSLQISALSFDGYAYYRWLRRSVVFNPAINQYIVWYAVLQQLLTDFTWPGVYVRTKANGDKVYKNSGMVDAVVGEGQVITKYTSGPNKGDIKSISYTPWTGLTRNNHFNAKAQTYLDVWPKNSPAIEMPPPGLLLYKDYPAKKTEVVSQKSWRGYDMHMVGTALEEWADTETIDSISGGKRFEYKVVCWFDSKQQRFRQRYVFGEMVYGSTVADEGLTGNNPKPTDIRRPLLGRVTKDDAMGVDNKLVFDYPGHVATWSLSETMDAAATRVIVTDNLDKATKHVYYAADKELLDVPNSGGAAVRGTQGWLLYDQTASREIKTSIVSGLKDRAIRLLQLFSVPLAQQISELKTTTAGQRPSIRATTFQVTLYQEPTMPFPDFTLGDWATFALTDPFYGGTMYLVRRIIGYSVTVVPDQESDYSHETIELELTDDNQVELG
jgi:hypothetical protein